MSYLHTLRIYNLLLAVLNKYSNCVFQFIGFSSKMAPNKVPKLILAFNDVNMFQRDPITPSSKQQLPYISNSNTRVR